MSRRCRDGRMAWRFWRLVANGPDRQVCTDLSRAQHAGAAANGEWHRSGRVERHREVPRARVRVRDMVDPFAPSVRELACGEALGLSESEGRLAARSSLTNAGERSVVELMGIGVVA